MPHTRGDEPRVIDVKLVDDGICPTHVGMNRMCTYDNSSIINLPHTRGDEPGATVCIRREEGICPTHVGMNQQVVTVDRFYPSICPTHVGMNR